MKRILTNGCSSISYNNNYICTCGNKIGVINRKTDEVYSFYTPLRNIISTSMDEQYLYVKTSNGIYGAVNIEAKEIEYRGFCREKDNTSSHDYKFFCIEKGVVLDVLDLKDNKMYAVKYNLINKSFEKLFLVNHDYYCCDWNVDYKNQKACFLLVETNSYDKPKTNCSYQIIDLKSFNIESKINLSFEHKTNPKCLIGSHMLLLDTMEIVNLYTNDRFLLDVNNQFYNTNNGYFCRCKLSIKHQLILVFSEKVFVYNIENQQLLFSYDCKYGSCAEQIDDKIFIGTWDGLFIAQETQGDSPSVLPKDD